MNFTTLNLVLNGVVGMLAVALFGLLFDRFRQIAWGTARPMYVAMYWLKMIWACGVVGSAITADVEWYQLFGVCGILCWVCNTRRQWRNGPPAAILSQDADLDSRPHPHHRMRRATDVDIKIEL